MQVKRMQRADMQAGGHKVLVTGASGFYGRHLVPFLQATGYEPVAMTRRDVSFGGPVRVIKITDIETGIDWARHLDGVGAVSYTHLSLFDRSVLISSAISPTGGGAGTRWFMRWC